MDEIGKKSFLLEILDWDYVILGFVEDKYERRLVDWDTEDESELIKQVIGRMTDKVSKNRCNRVQVYEIKKIEDIRIRDDKGKDKEDKDKD